MTCRMRWCWMTWFVRESVPDCRRSIRKWPLTKRVCVFSGSTENGSIRRWAKLAGWPIESQEFSQVIRGSRVEAITIEKREFVHRNGCAHRNVRSCYRFIPPQRRWFGVVPGVYSLCSDGMCYSIKIYAHTYSVCVSICLSVCLSLFLSQK